MLGLAAAGIASNLQKMAPAAAPADRILVCLYLLGGNDRNLIVPLDAPQYKNYARLRGALALAAGDLLPVQASRNSGTYGFYPALSEVRDLYNQGAAAVVALLIGGSVLGRDIYGVFPDMATAARDADGGWVPTTSREEYLSTLANWAGVPYSDLRGISRLRGTTNLGFMA